MHTQYSNKQLKNPVKIYKEYVSSQLIYS